MKLLILLIMIAACNDIYGQQYVSGVSERQTDSIITLIKKQGLKESNPFFLSAYKLVDSQTEVAKIYSMEANDIENFDYSKKLLPYLRISSFISSNILYKKNDGINNIFAMVNDDASLSPIVMCNISRTELKELKTLLSIVDTKHDAIFELRYFDYFFVLKNNDIYVFVDGMLKPAIPYFKTKYTIEEFRKKFVWICDCTPVQPSDSVISLTPEELEEWLKK